MPDTDLLFRHPVGKSTLLQGFTVPLTARRRNGLSSQRVKNGGLLSVTAIEKRLRSSFDESTMHAVTFNSVMRGVL